ncbi:MAG: D-alanyl-D-alanine carboxypeptidase [Clostridia bacterium]|nr:D-alanyl-D-alanine carboxypeptidase [Clostridia bacterium]
MKQKWNFKKLVIVFFILMWIILNFSYVFATSEEPNLISQAAILMDNKTGKILYAKNQDEKMYPASTTKIMTAILTLENCHLDDLVTISYDVVMSIPDGYSSASLQVGEQLTVEQLLQLLLVHSANDSANALAEYIGGSIESFISMMNTKVHELGLSNTHFTNAFGMHDENHYTTASDLAMIMKYCIENEDFRKIAGKASCAIPATNKYGTRSYVSTNELIVPNTKNYYPFLTCGKTGYTTQAGDCLVSCSYKDDLELICVILGGKTVNNTSTRFSETKTLYEYGYDNYSIKTLLNQNDFVTTLEVKNATKDTKTLEVLANTSLEALVENSFSENDLNSEINLKENLKAPIEEGDILGNITYMLDGVEYKTDLIASHSVKKSELLNYVLKFGLGIFLFIAIYSIFFRRKTKRRRKKVKNKYL